MPRYLEFLDTLVGIEILAAKKKYEGRLDGISVGKLSGLEDGFGDCLAKTPTQILDLLEEAKQQMSRHSDWQVRADRYAEVPYRRCESRVQAIETVLSVLGAALGHQIGVPITKEAIAKAVDLLHNRWPLVGDPSSD